MAPTRKSRSLNKQLLKLNEDSPDNGLGGNKSRKRKRKVSDMLGSQWSKEELGRFYKAYRKYGTNWNKVASFVRSRSVEMVAALYNMNKAYLSLPEGTASNVGLVAMMTDHYNVLDVSESDRESNGEHEVSRKAQKRGPGKSDVNTSKDLDRRVPDLLHSQSAISSNGCLSLLKKRPSVGNLPRVVGKRTPRVSVSINSDGEKYVSLNKAGLKSDGDSNVKDVAQGMLALTKGLQTGHSSQGSQTLQRKATPAGPLALRNCEQRDGVELVTAKHIFPPMGEEYRKGSSRNQDSESQYLARNNSERVEVGIKRKHIHQKNPKCQEIKINEFDGIRKAYKGVKEHTRSPFKEKCEGTVSRIESSSPGRPSKKSKLLDREDECSSLDGLHALADAFINLGPAQTVGSDSSVKVGGSLDVIDTCKQPEVGPSQPEMPRPRISVPKRNGKHNTGHKVAEVGKNISLDFNLNFEPEQESHQATSRRKMDHKAMSSKLRILFPRPRAESEKDLISSESPRTEAILDERKNYANKPVTQFITLPKQGKSVGLPESLCTNANQQVAQNYLDVPVGKMTTINHVSLPTKVRSRRKKHTPKAILPSQMIKDQRCGYSSSLHSSLQDPKQKLSHCLSSQLLRKWCAFEWFYSAIDYPWFSEREFVEYLNHVGLGHVSRLTRVEWGVIRSSLGKPRRLSQNFLGEEKEKLDKYRESVRTHYTELRSGSREVLPSDLAPPLSVGQRVIACHPKTRGLHDGSILTVERTRCRVQFDRPELGVELVMDIDCMPADPVENMPYALQKHNTTINRDHENSKESLNSRPIDLKVGRKTNCAPHENSIDTDGLSQIPISSYTNTSYRLAKGNTISAISQAQTTDGEIDNVLLSYAQIQAVEANVQALAKLRTALHKKEVLVTELRDMNCEVLKGHNDGDTSLKDSEIFRNQYGEVIVQLKGANEQVHSALLYLMQRNSHPPGPPLLANSCRSVDHSVHLDDQESGSHVVEVVEISNVKARKMVDIAMQAMSSLKEGQDALTKVAEALDVADSRHSEADSGLPPVRPFTDLDPICLDLPDQDQAASCTSELKMTVDAADSKPTNGSEQTAPQIPSALISSCVATLFMIQECTERQLPPAEAAHILDSALTSLRPCCSQNISIYREIEMCMGMVKNQILARIPT